MANFIYRNEESGDLFGGNPVLRPNLVVKHKPAPELTAARVLCRQLRREQSRPDKQRIAHLICLNLLSMLRQHPPRP